jgi:hypothetical protein
MYNKKVKKLALGGNVDDTKLMAELGRIYGKQFGSLQEATDFHRQNQALYQKAQTGQLNADEARMAKMYQQAQLVLQRNPEANKYVSKSAQEARGTFTGDSKTGGAGELLIDQFQDPNIFKQIDTEQITLGTDKKPTILPKGKTTVLNTPKEIQYYDAVTDLNSPSGFSSRFSSQNVSVDPNVANLSNVKDYQESMVQSKYLQKMNNIVQQAMQKGDKQTLDRLAGELDKGGYGDYAKKIQAGKPLFQDGGMLGTDIKDTGRRKKDYLKMSKEQLMKELDIYSNYDFETQPIEPQSLMELKQVLSEMDKQASMSQKKVLPKKKMQDGGMMPTTEGVVEGASHSQGGVPAIDTNTGEQVAEVEGGERIDSVEDTQVQDQMVQAIMNSQDEEEANQLATELGWYIVDMIQKQNQNQMQQEMPIAKNGMKLLNKF